MPCVGAIQDIEKGSLGFHVLERELPPWASRGRSNGSSADWKMPPPRPRFSI